MKVQTEVIDRFSNNFMEAFKITQVEFDAPLSDKKPSTLIKHKTRSIFGKQP